MSRPKKYRKSLNCRLDGHVWDKLNDYCDESGLSKTVAVEQAIEMYIKQKKSDQEKLRKINGQK